MSLETLVSVAESGPWCAFRAPGRMGPHLGPSPHRRRMPASCCSRPKVTSRIELAEATPTAMIAPISDGTLSVVPVM